MQLNEALKIPGLTSDELIVKILSSEMLNLNVTSTLMDLYIMVHKNWTQDMHGEANDTGKKLYGNKNVKFKNQIQFSFI